MTINHISIVRDELKVCPARGPLAGRTLINGDRAEQLEALFKLLGNRTRLLILHSLVKAGELCVSDLASGIGMQSQAVSNQLKHLADRSVVCSRRDGNSIYYRVIDRCVIEMMDRGLCQIDCVDERTGYEEGTAGDG